MSTNSARSRRRLWIAGAVGTLGALLLGTLLTFAVLQEPYTAATGTVTSVQKHFQAKTWHYRTRVDLGDSAVTVEYQNHHPSTGDTVTVYHSETGWATMRPAAGQNIAGGWMFACVFGMGAACLTVWLFDQHDRRRHRARAGRRDG